MKLKYKSIGSEKKKSIVVERINMRHYEQNWHYHNEHELVYYLKGKGTRVVGDNLSEFKKQDLVLVGAGLPHLWKNSEELEAEGLDALIVKFDTNQKGLNILEASEFNDISKLLQRAQAGIKFSENTAQKVHDILMAMLMADEAMKIILLLQLLNELSHCEEYSMLASPEFSLLQPNSEEYRLNRIVEFLSTNYTQPLTLDDISNKAAMTPNSLCRFFKTRTNRTIFQYLNEFRVGKACELLINGKLSISEVCFETGFNSLTSFNRVFKDIKNVTPRDFKRKYQVLNSDFTMQAYSA